MTAPCLPVNLRAAWWRAATNTGELAQSQMSVPGT